MNTQEFVEKVRSMAGLKPDVIEHLVTLSSQMNDEQRDDLIAKLEPIHEDIVRDTDELLHEIDEGEKELRQMEKEELPARMKEVEDREKASAEAIFDDSQSAA